LFVTDYQEISTRILKARLAFTNLRYLWRRRDIRLSTKGRVYCAAVCFVLLYGGETWSVRVEDICSLLLFDHSCLRSISRISCEHRVSNVVVRKRVLVKDGKSLDEVVIVHQLRWLGHVLPMPNHRLLRRAMFYDVGVGWKKARGGHMFCGCGFITLHYLVIHKFSIDSRKDISLLRGTLILKPDTDLWQLPG
uniref:Polyprotein n=1 Tax=Schistosoma curassoni TaxID=6186 RepID=A0A183JGD6_9TREM